MRELCSKNDLQWYAFHVQYQHEARTGRLLSSKGWETLVPTYRSERQWSDRIKQIDLPLFPGYVLSRCAGVDCKYVEDTPGVLRTVRFEGHPVPISPREIGEIQTLLASRAHLSPWPFLKAGDRVRVERGPLRGTEGILLKDQAGSRIIVSVEMLQRSIAAEVDPGMVVPLRIRTANRGA
jgi:transcription antitermination factor NusG